MDFLESDDVDPGRPGGSLLRTYEQRRADRQAQVRARLPRLGGLVLALSQEPETTTAFLRGARGEQRVADRLQRRCGPDVSLLFNRSLGRARRDGDIDLVAVTPTGVTVVDVKHYAGATVEVRRSGGVFGPVREQLFIRGHDRTSLLGSLRRQRSAVRAAVNELPGGSDIPVRVAFCFVDARLPLLCTPRIDGVPITASKQLARWLNKPGPIPVDRRRLITSHLARELPPA